MAQGEIQMSLITRCYFPDNSSCEIFGLSFIWTLKPQRPGCSIHREGSILPGPFLAFQKELHESAYRLEAHSVLPAMSRSVKSMFPFFTVRVTASDTESCSDCQPIPTSFHEAKNHRALRDHLTHILHHRPRLQVTCVGSDSHPGWDRDGDPYCSQDPCEVTVNSLRTGTPTLHVPIAPGFLGAFCSPSPHISKR